MINVAYDTIKKMLLVSFAFSLLSACSTYRFPGVYRITVQQGNVITQAMIDKLKPGMTRRQVKYVLGSPVVDDSLNRDQWDYIYTIEVPGFDRVERNLKIYFVAERLSYFEGDFAPSEAKAALTKEKEG